MAGPRRSPRSAPNGQKTAVGIKDSRSRGGAAEKPTVSDSSSPRGRRSTRSRATGENRSESADRSTAAGSTPSPSRRNQALLSTDATAVGEGPGEFNFGTLLYIGGWCFKARAMQPHEGGVVYCLQKSGPSDGSFLV